MHLRVVCEYLLDAVLYEVVYLELTICTLQDLDISGIRGHQNIALIHGPTSLDIASGRFSNQRVASLRLSGHLDVADVKSDGH